MTQTQTNGGLDRCECDDPQPGPDDAPRDCATCGGYILGAIIGGEVHPGYTHLGNGQPFFREKEHWSLNTGSRGGINTHDEGEWFRSFGDATVVVPHHTEDASTHGTLSLSFDHIVWDDGTVESIIDNRRIEDLPDGPNFPVETGDVPDPRE